MIQHFQSGTIVTSNGAARQSFYSALSAAGHLPPMSHLCRKTSIPGGTDTLRENSSVLQNRAVHSHMNVGQTFAAH
jgi:hypothetical protein